MRIKQAVYGVLLTLFLVPIFSSAFGGDQIRETLLKEARKVFSSVERIEVDAASDRILIISGDLGRSTAGSVGQDVSSSLANISPLFGLNPLHDQFRVKSIITDELGMTHTRLEHFHHGIPVVGSELILHADGTDKIRSMNGSLIGHLDIDMDRGVSSGEALNIALHHCGPASYRWEDAEQERILREVFNDENKTWRPSPELVVAPVNGDFAGEFRLAWKMTIPIDEAIPANWVYFVDAVSGEVINVYNALHTATGTGSSLYSGTVSFQTNLAGSTYEMRNVSRNILTYNGNNSTSLPGTLFTDTDNVWNSNVQRAAVDAHWGAEKVHQYYQDVHGRNSFNNAGGQIRSTVHHRLNYNNAFWNGSQMAYGDGDGTTFTPLVSLDICGHELTHAVTEYSSNLIYQGESGALNESMSDVFGTAIEFYATPSVADWLVGEDCYTPGIPGDALRSMSNPNANNNPDTYGGTYWINPSSSYDYGGVHINSGVSNFAFYLLTQGGSGTNDHGTPYSVSGIGIAKSRAIFYRANTVYMTSSSNFAAARVATQNSAIDLYGAGSNEVNQVLAAWAAVGVGTSGGGGGNLALNKPVTVSSTYSSSYAGSRAVDGSTSTFWRSATINNSTQVQWLYVDLGSVQTVARAITKWSGSYYARTYQIQVWSGSSWVTVANVTGSSGSQTATFAATSAQYVRINVTVRNSSSYRIQEFELYGTPSIATSTPEEHTVPASFDLKQNYPNPFNPSTTIGFSIPQDMHVSLKVFNVLGQEVATLVDEVRLKGEHSINFQGGSLASGVYFYELRAGGSTIVKRLHLMK